MKSLVCNRPAVFDVGRLEEVGLGGPIAIVFVVEYFPAVVSSAVTVELPDVVPIVEDRVSVIAMSPSEIPPRVGSSPYGVATAVVLIPGSGDDGISLSVDVLNSPAVVEISLVSSLLVVDVAVRSVVEDRFTGSLVEDEEEITCVAVLSPLVEVCPVDGPVSINCLAFSILTICGRGPFSC